MVLHLGKENKCAVTCPELKVHKDTMKGTDFTRYLVNILSTAGGQHDNIEDRRSRGWVKESTIMGILSEVDMGQNRSWTYA